MSQSAIIWLTIGIYIAAMVIIGVVSGRKSKSVADFTVGGRNAGAWLSALSYGAAYFSAVMFVGYAGGTGLKYGLWGIAAGIGNAVFGSWLAWKMLARKTREVSGRLKIKTMPEFFAIRYSSRAIKLFSCIVIFIFLIPYSASVYKGLASVADVLLGIDDTVCMIIIAVVSALLLLFGGYLVQARADFVQGLVMMFGVALLIIFVVRSDKVGGIQGVMDYAKTSVGLPKLSADAALMLISTVLMTSFGTWGLPQMIQKYFGIRDDKQAKRGVVISTFFALLVAGGGYFIGSLCHMFFTKDQIAAFPTPAQDYVVPNMLKASNLPAVLLGVVIVLLLAASVSTLCSITLTASSTLSLDFVKSVSKKSFTDKNLSVMTKVFCVLFIVASYAVANTDTPILDMMSYSWGIVSGSFMAPYVVALFWKKLNKGGAWSAILSGFTIALVPAVCKILTLTGITNGTVVDLAGRGPVFACIATAVSFIMAFVGTFLFKSASDKESSEFFYNGVVEKE